MLILLTRTIAKLIKNGFTAEELEKITQSENVGGEIEVIREKYLEKSEAGDKSAWQVYSLLGVLKHLFDAGITIFLLFYFLV